MKRLAVVVMLLGLYMLSFAQYKVVKPTKIKGTDITWEITADGVLKFTGTGEIPGDPKITKQWKSKIFKDRELVGCNAIEIGEGITSIGDKFIGSYSFNNRSNPISLKLPQSLLSIGHNAFESILITNLVLPTNIKFIGVGAFSGYGYDHIINQKELILPESLEEVCSYAFSGVKCEKIIVNGSARFQRSVFNNCEIKELIFLQDVDLPKEFFRGLDNTSLSMPRILAREKFVADSIQADKNVNGYIAHRLPEWSVYSEQNKPESKVKSADQLKQEIEADIAEWQVKGEFESTAEWQKRVNDRTRQARIEERTTKYNKEVAEAQTKYAKEYKEVQDRYNSLRKKYADEFYARLTGQTNDEYKQDRPRLDNPYDADNQTFLLTTDSHGDILLQVPRSEASDFKNNYSNVDVRYDFAPKDEESVALTKMTFLVNGKEYVYDGKADAAYAIADVTYNFAPLEVQDLNISVNDFELPELAMTNDAPKTTVRTGGIESKKVDVGRRSLTAGSGANGRKAEKADVDINVPNAGSVRDNTFALIIANENYRRVAGVPYALNDGEIMRQYFNKALGIPEKNILTATDASLNDINYNIDRVSDICKAFKGDASLIVYYAGHGVPAESSLDAYLLPVDGYAERAESSGLSLDAMVKTLESLPTKQTIVFLDACFSGTGRKEEMLSSARGVVLKAKAAAVRNDNMVLFSASQGDETAHPYDEKGHGLFTYFLLKKLGETSGEVTLGELSEYLTDNVLRQSAVNGRKQTPSVKVSAGNTEWKSSKL